MFTDLPRQRFSPMGREPLQGSGCACRQLDLLDGLISMSQAIALSLVSFSQHFEISVEHLCVGNVDLQVHEAFIMHDGGSFFENFLFLFDIPAAFLWHV